jgi:hypothetical protein
MWPFAVPLSLKFLDDHRGERNHQDLMNNIIKPGGELGRLGEPCIAVSGSAGCSDITIAKQHTQPASANASAPGDGECYSHGGFRPGNSPPTIYLSAVAASPMSSRAGSVSASAVNLIDSAARTLSLRPFAGRLNILTFGPLYEDSDEYRCVK